jgi:digeranylgeranylglycerophospholipid reductase
VGFVCSRSGMDQDMASLAEAEGARINFGERVRDSFRSAHVIGADGPLSTVARHFGFPPITRFAATLQAAIPYRCEDPDAVEVHISNSMFPGFFAWVIPHDECTAEFGVGVEMPARAQDAWARLLRLKGLDSAPRPKGAAIPLAVRSVTGKRAGRGSVLLAGDAAGQVKSTTGGGVIFGGNCARFAGMHATAPLRYEMEWRSRFGADLKIHSMAHDYLSSLSERSLADLGRRLKKLNFDGYLSKHGHMDRPTRMMRPQLVLLMLRQMIGL